MSFVGPRPALYVDATDELARLALRSEKGVDNVTTWYQQAGHKLEWTR